MSSAADNQSRIHGPAIRAFSTPPLAFKSDAPMQARQEEPTHMQPLTDNARTFGQHPEEFAKPAEGQFPRALFITCSDSRFVPPHTSLHPTSEAATIE